MTSTQEEPHPPSEAWIFYLAVVIFALIGSVTYFGGWLTTIGTAIVAGSAAALTGVVAAPSPRRRRGGVFWLTIVTTIAGVALPFAFMQRSAPPGVLELVGGCEPFTVIAQNRWSPVGATSRAEPLQSGKEIARYGGNSHLTVNGWVRTRAAYPENPPPWNRDVWFHLADNSGWVSFASVRADTTPFDVTGLDPNGGREAPTPAECSGTVRW